MRQIDVHRMLLVQDSEIFTSGIKPHFTYHSPPLPQTRFTRQAGVTGKIGNFEYEHVAPKEEFTQALARAEKVEVPEALSKQLGFRPTEFTESPEIVSPGKKRTARPLKVFVPKTFTPEGLHDSMSDRASAPPSRPKPQTFVPALAADGAAAPTPLWGGPVPSSRGERSSAEGKARAVASASDAPDVRTSTAGQGEAGVQDADSPANPSLPPPPATFMSNLFRSRGQHSRRPSDAEQGADKKAYALEDLGSM
jgi:hypothetical protein